MKNIMEIGMMQTIPLRNNYYLITIISILFSLIACSYVDRSVSAKTIESKKMNTLQVTLWQIIDSVPKLYPLNKENIEKFFNIKLTERVKDSYNYEYSESIQLLDGIIIGTPLKSPNSVHGLDLRVNAPNLPAYGVFNMNLNMSGKCTTIDQVKTKYKNLLISAPPSPQPINPAKPTKVIEKWHAAYTSTQPWGELTFGFETIAATFEPTCLEYVSFGIKAR
jgi:hypothetical protein